MSHGLASTKANTMIRRHYEQRTVVKPLCLEVIKQPPQQHVNKAYLEQIPLLR